MEFKFKFHVSDGLMPLCLNGKYNRMVKLIVIISEHLLGPIFLEINPECFLTFPRITI